MKITDDHEVTESEQIARFACGAALGFVAGLLLYALARPASVLVTALLFMFSAGVPGILALYYGDRFWYKLAEMLRQL